MEYGVSTSGSRTIVPTEWARLIAAARTYPESAQIWFLRTISAWDYSAAQHVSNALGLATPLVATGSADACRALILRWVDGAETSAIEKAAIAAAWRIMDPVGAR